MQCEKVDGQRAKGCYRTAKYVVAGVVTKREGITRMPARHHWNGCKKHTDMARSNGAQIVKKLEQEAT